MTITLESITEAEEAMAEVRSSLAAMGRELYQMRYGDELARQYAFEEYSLQTFQGSNYLGQEGPHWGVGTPIISLNYYWSRAGNSKYVTFPQSYLGKDWQSIEQERIDNENKIAVEREALKIEEAARRQEIAEREAYERLHAKYGNAKSE